MRRRRRWNASSMADPAVAAEGRMTGIDTNGFSPTQPNSGTHPRHAQAAIGTHRTTTISTRLRDALTAAVPAADFDFHQILEDQLNDLSGESVADRGLDRRTEPRAVDRLREHLDRFARQDQGRAPIRSTASPTTIRREASRPAQARLAALGVGAGDLADALSARTQGTVATQLAGDVTLSRFASVREAHSGKATSNPNRWRPKAD